MHPSGNRPPPLALSDEKPSRFKPPLTPWPDVSMAMAESADRIAERLESMQEFIDVCEQAKEAERKAAEMELKALEMAKEAQASRAAARAHWFMVKDSAFALYNSIDAAERADPGDISR